MTTHLTENKHWQIATFILEGDSFSKVAKRFDISKAGAAKIFHRMKYRVFPLISERERLGLDMECVKSFKNGWLQVKGFWCYNR